MNKFVTQDKTLIEAGLPVIRVGSYVRFSSKDIKCFITEHTEKLGK